MEPVREENRKVLPLILIVVLLSFSFLVLYLNWTKISTRIKDELTVLIEEKSNFEVELGEIEVGGFNSLQLKDLDLKGKEKHHIVIDEVKIYYNLLDVILQKADVVESISLIELVTPEVKLNRDSDQLSNKDKKIDLKSMSILNKFTGKVVIKEGSLVADITKNIDSLQAISGNLDFSRDNLTFDLKTKLPGRNNGEFTLNGTTNLQQFQVNINLVNLNVNLFSHKLQQEIKQAEVQFQRGKVNGNLKLAGDINSFSLAEFDYTAELEFRDSLIKYGKFAHEIEVEQSDLAINSEGIIIKQLVGEVGDSRLSLTGSVKNWENPSLHLNYEGSHIDMTMFQEWLTPELRLIGEAEITGEIKGALANPIIKSKVKLPTGELNGYNFRDLRFDLKYNNQLVNVNDFKAELATGDLTGRGTINWSKGSDLLYTGSIELSAIDLAELEKSDLDLTGKLDGSLIISGQNSLADLSALGSAEIQDGAWRGYKFKELNTNFWSSDKQLSLSNLTMKTKKGKWQAKGLIKSNRTLNLDITANNIDLSQLPGLHNYQTLDGVAFVQGQLQGKIDNPYFEGDIEVEELSYQDRQFAKVVGEVVYKKEKIELNGINLRHQNRDYELTGNIKLTEIPQFNLDLRTREGKLEGLYKLITSQKAKNFKGDFIGSLAITGNFNNLKASGKLKLLNGKIQNIDLESGLLNFSWQDEKMQVKKLKLAGLDSQLTGQGEINKDGQLDIELETRNMDVSNFNFTSEDLGQIKGKLDFSGKLKGNITKPDLIGQIKLKRPMVMNHNLQSIAGRVEYVGEKINFYEVEIIEGKAKYEINGSLDLSDRKFANLNLEMVNGNLPEVIEFLPLEIEHKLPYGFYGEVWINGRFKAPHVRGKVMISDIDDEGYLALNGSYDFKAGTDLFVTAKDFALTPLNRFMDLEQSIAGNLNAKTKLTGKLANLNVDSELKINNGYVGDFNYHSLKGELVLKNGQQLQIKQGLEIEVDEQNLAMVNGYFPLWAKDESFYVDVDFKKANLSLLSSWIPQVKSAQGASTIQLAISGTRNSPHFTGEFEVDNGKLQMVNLPYKISNLTASLNIREQKLIINKLSGLYGEGKFEAQGDAVIDRWKLSQVNMGFKGDNIPIKHGSWRGENDLDLKIGGTFQSPLLAGEILAHDTKILIPFEWPSGSEESEPLIRPRYDLEIKPGNNVKISNDNIDITVEKGSLKMSNDGQGLDLTGTLRSKTGHFNYYNTSFELEKGEAVFDNYGGHMPKLNLTAKTEVLNVNELQQDNIQSDSIEESGTDFSNIDEVKITLKLDGPADNMDVLLQSDPPLTREEIVNLLAQKGGLGSLLDKNYNQMVQKELLRVLQTGVRVELFSSIEETLEEKWDLDKFKIYSGTRSIWKVELGKYLTRELFLKYNQAFNEEEKRSIGFEYTILDSSKDIILDGSMNNEEEYRLELEANFPFN